MKFIIIFAYTQLPLALAEGLLTVVIFDYIKKLRPDILKQLGVIIKPKAPDVAGGK
jgi:cobalt/nickel transport system permease protein